MQLIHCRPLSATRHIFPLNRCPLHVATPFQSLKGDFDVRWLRGSASELIFAPWARAIEAQGGCRILGGKRVSNIGFKTSPSEEEDQESSDFSRAVRVETADGEVFEADAVVLAVGITAAKVCSRDDCNWFIGWFENIHRDCMYICLIEVV